MRFFALETDIGKIKERFCSQEEKEVLFTRYHGLCFLFSSIRELFITIILFAFGIFSVYMDWPLFWIIIILVALWFIFVFFNILKAYIDWMYDFILVTSDKVILMDQTSFFHHKVNPIHIESITSVSGETQFWGLFPFGTVCINLRESHTGSTVKLRYVPHANDVAAKISEVVTYYQRYVDGSQPGNIQSQDTPQGA